MKRQDDSKENEENQKIQKKFNNKKNGNINTNNTTNKNYKKVGKTKKKKKHKVLKRVLLTLFIIIVALLAYFFIKVHQNGGGMQGIVTTVVGSNSEKVKNLDDIYVLCIGQSDYMTDTIMVVKYSPKSQQASILSIPRDSFVGKNTATATASDKINARYQISPQATIDAVNDLTGLNLKYYLTVDTKALRDLVDAIGGIYFDVPIDMDYDDSSQDLAIHLKAGYQLLNGEQAEGVVRFRHNNNGTSYPLEYGDNDLGRMKTQRAFITEVLKQTIKASNITKINQLITIAKEKVQTNLSWEMIKDYIAALTNFNTENLRTDALPGVPQYLNNLSFYVINKKQAREKVNELFLITPEDVNSSGTNSVNENEVVDLTSGNTTNTTASSGTSTGTKSNSSIKLEVLNGTGSNSKFNEAISQLQEQGYKITKKGTTNTTRKTLIIDRNNNTKETANKIKGLLCTGITTSGENNNNVDFTIIIGTDY